MKLLYFARVKESTGVAEEEVMLPRNVTTVAGVVEWLKTRGEGYTHAFADLAIIRCAVDQQHGDLDTPIAGASEIAFFPPVTGG
ncbi:MAG: molybdopterin converting factor subunit 1 [Parvibaculum sp.]